MRLKLCDKDEGLIENCLFIVLLIAEIIFASSLFDRLSSPDIRKMRIKSTYAAALRETLSNWANNVHTAISYNLG